jgi:hypothetical protein
MIIVERRFKNIYGVFQYETLYKSDDYFKSEKFFKNYKTADRLELWNSLQGELLAVREVTNA